MKNQKGESFAEVMFFMACLSFFMFLGYGLEKSLERSNWQTEAVNRGCAEWIIAADGSTTFQWKEAAK